MKIFYWNLRGIANVPTQDILKKFVRDHQPEVLCISEPFISLDSIPTHFWTSMNLVAVCTNDRGAALPNLWFNVFLLRFMLVLLWRVGGGCG